MAAALSAPALAETDPTTHIDQSQPDADAAPPPPPAPPVEGTPNGEQVQTFLQVMAEGVLVDSPTAPRQYPGPSADEPQAELESESADTEDQPALPWRHPQLRPQEGLTRWLDFDAYDGWILDYDVRHYPRGGVSGKRGRLDMTRHHFAAGIMDSDESAMGINTRINWLQLSSDATLPDGRKLPSNLMDVQVEVFVPWFPPLSEFSIAFGSASDKPFASGDEMFVDITWLAPPISGNDGQFLFLINWNTNREFFNGVPLPGLAYRYHDEDVDNLKLVLGFPYSAVRWKATDWLQINAEYEFPRTVHTRVDFLLDHNVRLYGGFDWTNERFALHDRMEKDDRLFYYEKRLTAGARWNISDEMFIDVSGGWAFDRMFFEGRGYDDRDDNRLDIKDGPFIGLTFGWQF